MHIYIYTHLFLPALLLFPTFFFFLFYFCIVHSLLAVLLLASTPKCQLGAPGNILAQRDARFTRGECMHFFFFFFYYIPRINCDAMGLPGMATRILTASTPPQLSDVTCPHPFPPLYMDEIRLARSG